MPEQRQIIVDPGTASTAHKGARKDNVLRAIFPDSPIYGGKGGVTGKAVLMTDDDRRKAYQELALDGTVIGGLGFNAFSRDYIGSHQDPIPDLDSVETGGGGLPASPYVPNLSSPGPGNVNAHSQPAYSGDLPEKATSFGSGIGSTASPIESSRQIAKQSILGTYLSGRSYLGSDGKQ